MASPANEERDVVGNFAGEGVGERAKRRDRALRRGAISTVVVRLTMALTSFGTYAIAARVLTKDEFGLVAVLVSLWLILTMLDMGVGGALATRVATSHARADLADIRMHVSDALITMTAIGGLIAVGGSVSVLALPWQDWIGGTMPPDTLERSLIITFVVAGASLPAWVGHVCMTGMQRFATAQASLAAGAVAALIACGGVALARPPADLFILAMLGAPLAVSLGFTTWIVFGVLRGVGPAGGFEAARLKSMVRASGYYGLFNIGKMVSMGTSTVIVGAVLGLEEAALFSVASRLFNPILTVIVRAGSQVWPPMTEAIARGDVAWVRSSYRRGLVYVTGIGSVTSLAIVVFGRQIAGVWVGPDLVPSLTIFIWNAALTVVLAVTMQVGIVLMAVERVRSAAVLSLCTAVTGVVLSVLLIGMFGTSGAAIGPTVACLAILLPGLTVLARSSLRALEAPTNEGRL